MVRKVYNWKIISSDGWVLSSIKAIPLLYTPFKGVEPRPIVFSQSEQQLMKEAVLSLEDKNVIERCSEEEYQFISNIFMVPKPKRQVWIILDLSRFHEAVNKAHFKMSTIQTALNFVLPGIIMSSIDLQDTYFTFPITEKGRKFLNSDCTSSSGGLGLSQWELHVHRSFSQN